MQKQVQVSLKAPYYTHGELAASTRHVWIICHGYGQLAKHFLRRFDVLDPLNHYVIAPEGLSHFYLGDDYKSIGASWMTRENRLDEIHNQSQYLNSVFQQELAEIDPTQIKVNLLGFSQGTSTIVRWAVHQHITFDRMILWAGAFPPEIGAGAFAYLDAAPDIWMVYGDQDHFINEEAFQKQQNLVHMAFSQEINVLKFEGKHEVPREIIQQLIKKWK